MKKISYSRRDFIALTGAGIAGAAAGELLVGSAGASSMRAAGAVGTGNAAGAGGAASQAAGVDLRPQDAELIVINAKVYTVDARMPKAEAFAVKGGRFIAVGSTADIKGLAGKGTQTFDAKQMTVLPGFIDCHNHAPGTSLLYDTVVGNPYAVEFVTIDSIVEKLRAKAKDTPPGHWVEGFYFDDTKVKDARELNIHDLDRVSRDLPVAVHHRGGHTQFYNSKAFELAGVTKNTPNPAGGTFERDASGELTGRVTDRAAAAFAKAGVREAIPPDQMEERERKGLAFISKQFVTYGLTTVHHEGGDLFVMQKVRANGELLHRVSYEANGKTLEAMIAGGISTGFGDEWIRFGATSEHTVDGSFSERTMALSQPYPDAEPAGYKGNVTESQDDLNAWIERMHRAGIQTNCHANGDVAIDMVLTAVERAQKLYPRADARPKITHCTLINEDLVRRIKALGVVPALFTTYAYYNSDKFHFYGEELMKRSMAYRTLLDAGIPASAGSDFSAGPLDPRMGIQGMVTRTGWNGETWGANQRITVDEALRVCTINGAYNSHEEAIKGSITPSKLADFVVLADDIHTMEPSKIKDVQVVRTVVGGRTVYQA
jgi:predicted amidohydrolase YtcJ